MIIRLIDVDLDLKPCHSLVGCWAGCCCCHCHWVFELWLCGQTIWRQTRRPAFLCSCQSSPNSQPASQPWPTGPLMSVLERVDILEQKKLDADYTHTHINTQPKVIEWVSLCGPVRWLVCFLKGLKGRCVHDKRTHQLLYIDYTITLPNN